MIVFIIWLIFCFMIGSIGKNKRIGYGGAFAVSLLLSPIVGLIITLISKDLPPPVKTTVITYTCKWCKLTSSVNSHFCPGCDKDDYGKKKADYEKSPVL